MDKTESNFIKVKNKPISRIVCWRCKRYNVTLRAIKEDKGPAIDYVCEFCMQFGKPPIGNQSQVYFHKA